MTSWESSRASSPLPAKTGISVAKRVALSFPLMSLTAWWVLPVTELPMAVMLLTLPSVTWRLNSV